MKSRWTCRQTAFVALGAVGVVLGSLRVGLERWASSRIVPVAETPKLPAALVLGTTVTSSWQPSQFLAARLDLAAQLYARGSVDQLLLSGDGHLGGDDEPGVMRDYLISRGVPAEALILDVAGVDTFVSCRRAREVHGLDELVVVSQRYHLPRALAACATVGIDAWGVGDVSARTDGVRWLRANARELTANVKLLTDILSYRRAQVG